MRLPEFAADLQQFVCASNWMRSAIPEFSTVIAPLHDLLEQCYKQVGKRTKKSIRKVTLSGLWGTIHTDSFRYIQNEIAQSTRLAHRKKGFFMSLFSDASETHWSAVLTQVSEEQKDEDVEKQDHEPLSFLSGSFTGSASNWSIVEKEAFAVVEAMTKLHHLTASDVVSLFTDHANLIYIFDPYGRNPGIGKHTENKLMRWALKLSSYRYVIEHLPGEQNVWADLLTRWAATPEKSVRAIKLSGLFSAPITPELDDRWDWPNNKDLREAQRDTKMKCPPLFAEKDGLFKDKNDVIWIPEDNQELALRILVAAHCGRGGHRGIEPTLATVKKFFFWKQMGDHVREFVHSCLHCLCTAPASFVPRPLGHAIHASRPNEVLHFDFCYVGPSNAEFKYVLIIKDDFSSYTLLFPFATADSESVAQALTEWFSLFGVVGTWVSDQGSHFKNKVINELSMKLKSYHHFTLPYTPWTNGTVEVVCRELMRCMRALLSELNLPFRLWPDVLPLVQSVLNSTPLRRMGDRAPITVFSGLPQDTPLQAVVTKHGGETKTMELPEIRARQLTKAEELLASLDNMHRETNESVAGYRKKAVQRHNEKAGVRPCNFEVGMYVLRAEKTTGPHKKLQFKWTGPYRVTKLVSDFLFEVEKLVSGDRYTVHGSRLKFFRNADFNITEDCLQHMQFQNGEYNIVQEILDLREVSDRVEAQVRWVGFDDEEPTWEDVDMLKQDVPDFLENFRKAVMDQGTDRQKTIAKNM